MSFGSAPEWSGDGLGHRHLVDDGVGVSHAGGDLLSRLVQEPQRVGAFFFSVTAAATTGLTFGELSLMHAQTPADVVAAMRWVQVAGFFLFVPITWFVRVYLRAGRAWLVWTVTAVRTLYLLLTVVAGINVAYRTVTLRQLQFLGESVTIPGGVPNPCLLFGQFGIVADARLRRRCQRRHLAARRPAEGVDRRRERGVLPAHRTRQLVFGDLGARAGATGREPVASWDWSSVMGYELSRDLLRASQLVRELQVSEAGLRESEARMSLAVDAGDLGIWIWDLSRNDFWASDSWRALFGFGLSEPLAADIVMERVHPDDRDELRRLKPPRSRASNRRAIPDGVPAAAAGWHDPLDRLEGTCRVRRQWPTGPDARRLARCHRAQEMPKRNRSTCGRRSRTRGESR